MFQVLGLTVGVGVSTTRSTNTARVTSYSRGLKKPNAQSAHLEHETRNLQEEVQGFRTLRFIFGRFRVGVSDSDLFLISCFDQLPKRADDMCAQDRGS